MFPSDAPDEESLLSLNAAAGLLELSGGLLDAARRRGEIRGEPYRERWWHWFPRYRYRLDAVREYAQEYQRTQPVSPTLTALRKIEDTVAEAVAAGASDIHFEPPGRGRPHLRTRFRVDGSLRDVGVIEWPWLVQPLLGRLWLLSEEPTPFHAVIVPQTSELRRMPQFIPRQSVMRFVINERETWARLSSIATVGGIKFVLHLLPTAPKSLDALRFAPRAAASFRNLLDPMQAGLILFAAPSGDGLTTTLRAAMQTKATDDGADIVFFDDIADFHAPGVTVVVYDRKRDATLTEPVRSARRQGARLFVFGAITDAESARTAVETAEMGFAVWAGLRVPRFDGDGTPDDAADVARTRLRGYGVETEQLERVLRGVVGQRLYRRLCPTCREATSPDAHESQMLERFGLRADAVYRAVGCAQCGDTGYRGQGGLLTIYDPAMPEGNAAPGIAAEAWARFAAGETDAQELIRFKCLR